MRVTYRTFDTALQATLHDNIGSHQPQFITFRDACLWPSNNIYLKQIEVLLYFFIVPFFNKLVCQLTASSKI
jgi:hypothetical protein